MGRLRLTVQRVSVRGCVKMDNDYSGGHWFDYQPPIEWVSSAEKFFVDGMVLPYTFEQLARAICLSFFCVCACALRVCAHVNYRTCHFPNIFIMF